MKLTETKQDLLVLYKGEVKQLGFIAMEGLHKKKERRPSRNYGFLHKSFQEFLAALCQCCQPIDGEISVDSLISDCRYFKQFQQVLMFTSGMSAQNLRSSSQGTYRWYSCPSQPG